MTKIIKIKHEVLTKNNLRTFTEEQFIVDEHYMYVFAEDSPCVLTLKIDGNVLRDAGDDSIVGYYFTSY